MFKKNKRQKDIHLNTCRKNISHYSSCIHDKHCQRTRNQEELPQLKIPRANICWMIKKAKEFQKNIYFCCIDYDNAFGCVDHNKQWKILKEMGIPDHLTCLLRYLYAGQEAKIRTGHGKTD